MDGTSDRITALFNERDALINAGGNYPFWLNDGSVWLVQKGWVDVFCVRQTTTGSVTGRTHVTRIPQGQCVVGAMTANGNGGGSTGMLQAVSRPGTKLRHLPAATAHERFGTRTARAEAAELIDEWVDAVCTGLTDDPRPRDCQAIRQTSTIHLERGVTVFPASRVSWIAHRDGRSRLVGNSELPMGEGLIPCTKRTWFETDAPVDITVLSTQTVLATSDIWAALTGLQHVATRCALLRMEKEATREAVRQGQRDENRRQLLTSAFAELAACRT